MSALLQVGALVSPVDSEGKAVGRVAAREFGGPLKGLLQVAWFDRPWTWVDPETLDIVPERLGLSGLPLYFGCHGSTGHYLWNSYGPRAGYGISSVGRLGGEDLGWSVAELDGSFLPLDERGQPVTGGPEGAARFTLFAGCTILSFCDRSVDRRAGSHSTFVLPGDAYSFDSAVERARLWFPKVWSRYAFQIRQNFGPRPHLDGLGDLPGELRRGSKRDELRAVAEWALDFRPDAGLAMHTQDAMCRLEGGLWAEEVQMAIRVLMRERGLVR